MTVTLRPYQQEAVRNIRAAFSAGNKRVLFTAPCGAGKTMLFSYIAAGIYKNKKRAVILAHRKELLDQIAAALSLFNIPHAVVGGGYRGIPRTNIVVASSMTMVKRLAHWPAPHLIVPDECHHVTVGSSFGNCIDAFPEAKVLGVTATPCRLDGRGLGEVFQTLVHGPTVPELITLGYLVQPVVYAPKIAPDLSGIKRTAGDFNLGQLADTMDKPKITGDALTHYQKYANGKRAVAFCVSIRHARDVAEQFRQAGYNAAHVDGGMDDTYRRMVIRDFRAGKITILTSCDLISEGFDVPGIECAIALRPTQSTSLWLQQAGRSLRPAPGKTEAILLDHAGNTARHGFLDDVRDWSLDGGMEIRTASDSAPPVRTCPACLAMHRPMPKCPRCGHVYEVKHRVIEQVDGELTAVNGHVADPAAHMKEVTRQYYTLVAIAKKRRYAAPAQWAFNVIASKEARIRALDTAAMDELRAATIGRTP